MSEPTRLDADPLTGLLARALAFAIDAKPAVALLGMLLLGAGALTSPLALPFVPADVPRAPVSALALPDTGDNQQIVFAAWEGRAPADVEDQVTYPLASALLGLGGVRTVRSSSMLGFASLTVIFEEDVGFEASRARLVEALASLPRGLLPAEVEPTLGPEATALGQVLWYTHEARGPDGGLGGGFDLHELRELQDTVVAPALRAVPGVAEVAGVGGHLTEVQVEVDPEALASRGLSFADVARSVRAAHRDVGARTLELNGAEHMLRGLGELQAPGDLEEALVSVVDGAPVRLADVARVGLGPASRRGVLDDGGAEVVGGVVVVRHGASPREVIAGVRAALGELAPALPERVLDDGSRRRVHVVPFYDRTQLIEETLDTLGTALRQQLLVTLLVLLVMLRRVRASLVVALVPPLGVLVAFVLMKLAGVAANVMALAGIAIAIGAMVDVAIVVVENVQRALDQAPEDAPRAGLVRRAVAEVAPAVLTSVATTALSFLPVFALTAAEGKLFRPVAWTKTFGLAGALLVTLALVPALAHGLLRRGGERPRRAPWLVLAVGVGLLLAMDWAPLGPIPCFCRGCSPIARPSRSFPSPSSASARSRSSAPSRSPGGGARSPGPSRAFARPTCRASTRAPSS
ncbi:MAG: efflux RND transporter permease subunit [Myxococcota bacterium]